MLTKLQTHTQTHTFHQWRFKTQLFFFYFLFVSCRLFLIKEAPRSAIFHINYVLFSPMQACLSFSLPLQPSTHFSSRPPHYLIIVLSWCEREEDRREEEEEERKRGRWPTFYLSVFLFVCLIFLASYGLVEGSHSEPESL